MYRDDPKYRLEASPGRPRRWHRASELSGLAQSLMDRVSQGSHQKAFALFSRVGFDTRKGLLSRMQITPIYDPVSHTIKVARHHLQPAFWRRYGELPSLMIEHELSHAWDISRAKAEDGADGSYWFKHVWPKIAQATQGQSPPYLHPSVLPRASYMAEEVLEMPAILTEMARHDPDTFQALTGVFKEDYGIDLHQTLSDFWGTDVAAQGDPERVKRIGKWLRSVKAPKRRWRSSLATRVAYAEMHDNPHLHLLPSKKNPEVRRWQQDSAIAHSFKSGMHTYDWLDEHQHPRFLKLAETMRMYDAPAWLERVRKNQRMGLHPEDYRGFLADSDAYPDKSKFFGRTYLAWKPSHMNSLDVRGPDELALRMLGVAFPAILLASDPSKSDISINTHGDERDWYEQLGVSMSFRDAEGNDLLEISNIYQLGERDQEEDRREVHSARLELLSIHRRLQKLGLGPAIYAANHAHNEWIGSGSITLEANLSVGGYFWPLMGFEFADSGNSDFYKNRLKRNVEYLHDPRYLDIRGQQGLTNDEIAHIHRDIDDNVEYAWDIARYKIPQEFGPSDGDQDWRNAGRNTMLAQHYEAYRNLSEDIGYDAMSQTVDEKVAQIKKGVGG